MQILLLHGLVLGILHIYLGLQIFYTMNLYTEIRRDYWLFHGNLSVSLKKLSTITWGGFMCVGVDLWLRQLLLLNQQDWPREKMNLVWGLMLIQEVPLYLMGLSSNPQVTTQLNLMTEKSWEGWGFRKLTKGIPHGTKEGSTVLVILFQLVFLMYNKCLFLFKLLICLKQSGESLAETLQRIRERTRLAMQDPKVMSCKNYLM